MFGPTPVSGSVRDDARADLDHREAVLVRRILRVERRRQPVGDAVGRQREEHGEDDRQERRQPEVLEDEQQPDGDAGADPRVAREGQRQRHDERRHDERRPGAIARAEDAGAPPRRR